MGWKELNSSLARQPTGHQVSSSWPQRLLHAAEGRWLRRVARPDGSIAPKNNPAACPRVSRSARASARGLSPQSSAGVELSCLVDTGCTPGVLEQTEARAGNTFQVGELPSTIRSDKKASAWQRGYLSRSQVRGGQHGCERIKGTVECHSPYRNTTLTPARSQKDRAAKAWAVQGSGMPLVQALKEKWDQFRRS